MNYIKELNAFREWQLSNVLPANAISLWYTLMNINNSTGWKKRFNAPNTIVWQFSGLTKQGLLDARNKLKELNLINFEGGKRGQASVYEMIPLTQVAESTLYQSQDKIAHQSSVASQGESAHQSSGESHGESTYQSLDQFHGESIGESRPVLKHKQVQERRQEDKRAKPFLNTYEQNIGKLSPMVQDELEQWVALVGGPIVIEAIKRATKYGGQTYSYVEKVLQEWREANLATLDAVHAHESRKRSRKNNTVPFRKPRKDSKQSLFDELREEV